MDCDDARLLPASLILVFGGIAALMLAASAAIGGSALGTPLALIALVMVAASYALAPDRRWALRAGSAVSVLGVPIWLAALLAFGGVADPAIGLFCLGMAASSWWAMRFLGEELLPPPWERAWNLLPESRPEGPPEGWIEELPDGAAAASVSSTAPAVRTTSW